VTGSDESTLAYAELQPDDILTTMEELGYHCDGRFLALNSYENRVYQIGLENQQPVVTKFYRPGRWSDEAILEEHSFSIELADADIPVVAPLTLNEKTLHHSGNFRLSVSPCKGGRAPELDDQNMQRQLGRFVARMHLLGETKSFLHRPALDIETYGYQSVDFLLEESFVPESLEDAYKGLVEHLFNNIDACFERAGDVSNFRLHGDFHPGNVLVAGDRLHIVDLDDTRTGPSIQDLWMFLSGISGISNFRRARTEPDRGTQNTAHHALLRLAGAPLGGPCIQTRISLVQFTSILGRAHFVVARAGGVDGRTAA